MTDYNAIRMISGLMQRNVASEHEAAAVSGILARFPWFVPAQYAQAAIAHRKKEYSAEMLTAVYPYTGNWLMFLDHITGQPAANILVQEAEQVVMVEEIAPAMQQEMAATVIEVEVIPEPEQLPEEILATEPEIIIEEVTLPEVEPQETVIEDLIFTPIQADDYFKQQGISVSNDLPEDLEALAHGEEATTGENDARSLMVMMSFTEWLVHFKRTADKKNEEIEDQKAIRTMWQKEKLAAALEEENDEIPENVFEMAVNSIAKEEGLASESLAEIYLKQGKYAHAIEMYKKLSLRNPQKNAYFAAKIDEIIKERQ